MSRIFMPHVRVEGTLQVLLLRLADHANDDGLCWPSVQCMADSIRRSPRRTMELRDELIELGYLEIEGNGKTGPHGVNRYRVMIPPPPAPDASAHTPSDAFHVERHPANPRTVRDSAPCEIPQGTLRSPAGANGAAPQGSLRPAAGATCEDSHRTLRDLRHESSRTLNEPPYPPTAPTTEAGGGVGTAGLVPLDHRRREFFAELERTLERLGVASGPGAMRRWWRIAESNPLAVTTAQRLDLIHWCVCAARERGDRPAYASDVQDLVEQWIPDDLLTESEHTLDQPTTPSAAAGA